MMRSATAGALQQMRQSVARPYPVPMQLFALLAIVPFYIFIGKFSQGRTIYSPELALDQVIPLLPVWSLIYGALYWFLIILPVFIVREKEHVRRMFSAYLAVWLIAYVFFLLYPTRAPRPPDAVGEGFAWWGLQSLYDMDPPYNCLPSIHVAHSFVSAFACYGVHRKVGIFAAFCAVLVALSTLFTKQHYVLDLVGGILLASLCYFLFMHRYPREEVPEHDKRLAPTFAGCIFAVAIFSIFGAWVVYQFQDAF